MAAHIAAADIEDPIQAIKAAVLSTELGDTIALRFKMKIEIIMRIRRSNGKPTPDVTFCSNNTHERHHWKLFPSL